MKTKLLAMCLALMLCLSACVAGAETNAEPLELSVTMYTWKYTDGPESQVGQAWQALVEEKLGRELVIDWTFINVNEYGEKVQLMVNTNTLTDIVLLTGAIPTQKIIELGHDGMFVCFSDYDMPNLEWYMGLAGDDAKSVYLDEEDKLYMVPRVLDATLYGAATMEWGSAIRQDILDANSLETPKSFSELLDVSKKLKEIYPDSTPIVDAYGFQQSWCGYADNFRTSYDTYFTVDEMKYVFAPLSENYRAYLRFLNEAYENELIPMDYAAWNSDMCRAAVLNDEAFILSACVGNIFNESKDWGDGANWTILTAGLHDPEIGAPMTLKSHLTTPYSLNNWGVLAASASSAHLDDVVAFLDAYYSEDVQMLLAWGIEGESYVVNEDGSRTLTEKYAKNLVEGEDDAYTQLGCCSNTRPGGLWVNYTVSFKQAGNWPEYNILQPDGTIVYEKQKTYAVENIKAGYNCNEVDQALPSLTPEEKEEYSAIMAAVKTYTDECRAKFISGEMDIEADWDAYVEKAHAMGDINAALEIYNAKIADMELSY